MKIVLFGATGMVGQGVLRECLRAEDVREVVTVGRTATGLSHPKLRELVHADLFDYRAIEAELGDLDACFFCLGASASGLREAEYTRVNHDLPLAAAETLVRLNPKMVFVYVSGLATDSSEKGRIMWARVKGRTENALLRLPFKAAYMFRPGFIVPLHGERSRTALYRWFYFFGAPFMPALRRLFPRQALTTEQIGLAMLGVVRGGAPKPVLEVADIRAVADREAARVGHVAR